MKKALRKPGVQVFVPKAKFIVSEKLNMDYVRRMWLESPREQEERAAWRGLEGRE